jgi:hypothetical protein
MAGVIAHTADPMLQLVDPCQRTVSDETNISTGVALGSDHDVWMQRHHDPQGAF